MKSAGQEEQKPERPKQVLYAVYLIYASLTLGILNSIINIIGYQLRGNFPGLTLIFIVAFLILSYAILLLIAVKISAGRNWARILYLALFIIILCDFFGGVSQSFAEYPLTSSITAASSFFDLIAIVLLFLGPSNAWFKQIKKNNQAEAARQEDAIVDLNTVGAYKKVLILGRRRIASLTPRSSDISSAIAGLVASSISVVALFIWFSRETQDDPEGGFAIICTLSLCFLLSLFAGPTLGVIGGRIGAYATRKTDRNLIRIGSKIAGGFFGGLLYLPLILLIIYLSSELF